MGRVPAGAWRVGCIGRRSPGRSGGRGAPTAGAAGRGRWKIGWPGTGRPGAGRPVPAAGAPACAAGRAGALYTGRGPVCGTIMRGAGALDAGGITGLCATTGAGTEADAKIGGAATGGATAAGGGADARGGAGGAAGGAAIMGFSTGAAGRVGGAGVTGGAGGGVGFATGALTAGFATTGGGAAGFVGCATPSFCWVIALSTSPGREMCDKSILVLISSSPRGGRANLAAGVCPSDEPRMWARTFSASCSSRELECVFFSVTPTSDSTSRMALLFTSSSLARSLIRTLLIRPFLHPALCFKSSSQPHGVSFSRSQYRKERKCGP